MTEFTDQVGEELTALKRDRRGLDTKIKLLETLLGEYDTPQVEQQVIVSTFVERHEDTRVVMSRASPEKVKEHESPPNSIQEAIIDVLLDAEGPTHRVLILKRVRALGIEINGIDALSTLSAHASKDPRILMSGRGTWSIAPTHDDE